MLWASLYITVCSAKNRIRVRLRRLREPKYLIGAIVGGAYLYFTIFARTFSSRARTSRRPRTPPPELATLLGAEGPVLAGLAGLVLMAILAIGWLFPDNRLLEFTEAEIQFLFPAPVSRRQLLIHRLLRSQLGLLFAAIVPALMWPTGSGASRVRIAVAMWIILCTIRVHFTGVNLARASLVLRGGEARRRQWAPLVLMLAAIGTVGAAIARSMASSPVTRFIDVLNRLGEATAGGLPHVILWPFMALARPLFAPWPGPYLLALAGALAVLAVNVVWVLQSDAALQEAVAGADARRRTTAGRQPIPPKARATGWVLPLTGRPETFFMWKSVMQLVRETNAVTLVRYGLPLLVVGLAASGPLLRGNRGASAALGTFAAIAAGFAALLGPQMTRSDMRQDLLHLDQIKTWPIRGAAIVRGEMLWPATMLTLLVWLALVVAAAFWTAAFPAAMHEWRAAATLAGALLAPGLVAAQLTVHNAAAVLFPAWVPLGASRPRGIDAMGQRLILFAGVLLSLAVLMLPGLLAGGLAWLVAQAFIGPLALVPAAAVCTAIILGEVLVATEALGPVFERLDVSGIERSE